MSQRCAGAVLTSHLYLTGKPSGVNFHLQKSSMHGAVYGCHVLLHGSSDHRGFSAAAVKNAQNNKQWDLSHLPEWEYSCTQNKKTHAWGATEGGMCLSHIPIQVRPNRGKWSNVLWLWCEGGKLFLTGRVSQVLSFHTHVTEKPVSFLKKKKVLKYGFLKISVTSVGQLLLAGVFGLVSEVPHSWCALLWLSSGALQEETLGYPLSVISFLIKALFPVDRISIGKIHFVCSHCS